MGNSPQESHVWEQLWSVDFDSRGNERNEVFLKVLKYLSWIFNPFKNICLTSFLHLQVFLR